MILNIHEVIVIIPTLYSLILAAVNDYRTRKVPIKTWRVAVFVGIPFSTLLFLMKIVSGQIIFERSYVFIGSAVLFVLISMALGYMGVFGGADSIAMSIVALTSFYIGYPDTFLLRYTTILIVVCVLIPVLVFIKNIITRAYTTLDRGHLWFLFFGTMMPVEKFNTYHGIVLEDVNLYEDGDIETVFRNINLRAMETDEYYTTTNIYNDRSLYSIYARVDKVWVMWILPFVIPITVAYVLTILSYLFLA